MPRAVRAPLFACQPPPRGQPAPPGAHSPVSSNGTLNCRLSRANYTRGSPPSTTAAAGGRSARRGGERLCLHTARPRLRGGERGGSARGCWGGRKAPQGPGMDGSVRRAERGGAGHVRSLSHRRAPIPAAGTQRSGTERRSAAPPRLVPSRQSIRAEERGVRGRLLGQTPPKGGERKAPLLVPVVPHLRRWERSPRDGRGAASPPLGGAGFPQPPPPGTRPTDGRPRAARPRGKTARLLLQNGRSARDAARGAPPQRERRAGNAARPRPPHRLQRCCRARLGAERGWRLADATCSIYRCLRAKGGSKFLTVRTEKPAGSGYGCHTGTAEPSRSNRSAF